MKKSIKSISFVLLTSLFMLGACSDGDEETGNDNEENTQNESSESGNGEEMDHGSMNHSGSAEVPQGLAEAENPTYEVDSEAMIEASHMPGMEGAVATISGAFDTTVYSVTYTPTTDGDPVEDHKWVIHEEIEDAGEKPLQPGEEAVLNADHMEGMDGATATVDSAEQTTVYMVDYTDQETGEEVKYHKWVTENELDPVE